MSDVRNVVNPSPRSTAKMKWRPISTVLFAVVLTAGLAAAQDPYAVLGVSRTATQTEIKNSYRNLVKIWYALVGSHGPRSCVIADGSIFLSGTRTRVSIQMPKPNSSKSLPLMK